MSFPHASFPYAAAVALGSNLGDRAATIALAVARLQALDGVRVAALSTIRETEPIGGPPQGRYLNGVALLETGLAAERLLAALLTIEQEFGRVRRVRNGPRTLDLDLLFHDATQLATPELTLPHPRLHERRFVLEPLCDVAPDWIHPRLGRSARELLAELAAPALAAHRATA